MARGDGATEAPGQHSVSDILMHMAFAEPASRVMPRDWPVKTGDEIEVEIDEIDPADRGVGVGMYKGGVIFVEGAHPGERIRVRITKLLLGSGFGIHIASAVGERMK